MPAFVVLSVDTTANTVTSTGVAAAGQPEGSVLQTGDRLRLRNVGGALPAATPSLAGATDYWARRVTDDAIQIYDSNAHSLAGGSTGLVDITGGLGAGTTTIEFGLPYCLPTVNAAQGIQLRPFVVGAEWSALVALYNLLTGQAQAIWSTIVVALTVTFNALVTFAAGLIVGANQHITLSGTGRVKHGDYPLVLSAVMGQASSGWTFGVSGVGAQPNATCNVAGTLLPVWIPLLEGETISSVSFRALGNGTTSTLVCKVQVIDGSDSVTTIGTRTLAAGGGFPNSYANYAVTGLTPTAIPAGGGAWIQFDTGSSTGQSITRIVVNEAQA